jgi:hypothetical protein
VIEKKRGPLPLCQFRSVVCKHRARQSAEPCTRRVPNFGVFVVFVRFAFSKNLNLRSFSGCFSVLLARPTVLSFEANEQNQSNQDQEYHVFIGRRRRKAFRDALVKLLPLSLCRLSPVNSLKSPMVPSRVS